MKTEYIKLDNNNPDREMIKKAGEIIKKGGLVAFPTETVYGLGGDAMLSESSKRIYRAKGRPSDNPLIVHICEIGDLYEAAKDIPEEALLLAERFWPGPLTMIFTKRDRVPFETTGGLSTVAVRMPDNRIALDFIRAAGGFVAAPSANRSGRPSPTNVKRVLEDLDGEIEMIIDGGDSVIGLESTIIDMTPYSRGEKGMLLRPGFVTDKDLKELLSDIDYDPAVFGKINNDAKPRAPGMKYRHYAPKGELTIVKGEDEGVISFIRRGVREALSSGKRAAVIASSENIRAFEEGLVIDIGSRKDDGEIARRLYEGLRACDDKDIDVIYSEELTYGNLSGAIMNRLIKAAGGRIKEV